MEYNSSLHSLKKYFFKASTIYGNDFKKILENANTLFDKIQFKFYKDGIVLLAVSDTPGCVVNIAINKDGFFDYYIEKVNYTKSKKSTPKEKPIVIEVEIKKLKSVLQGMENYDCMTFILENDNPSSINIILTKKSNITPLSTSSTTNNNDNSTYDVHQKARVECSDKRVCIIEVNNISHHINILNLKNLEVEVALKATTFNQQIKFINNSNSKITYLVGNTKNKKLIIKTVNETGGGTNSFVELSCQINTNIYDENQIISKDIESESSSKTSNIVNENNKRTIDDEQQSSNKKIQDEINENHGNENDDDDNYIKKYIQPQNESNNSNENVEINEEKDNEKDNEDDIDDEKEIENKDVREEEFENSQEETIVRESSNLLHDIENTNYEDLLSIDIPTEGEESFCGYYNTKALLDISKNQNLSRDLDIVIYFPKKMENLSYIVFRFHLKTFITITYYLQELLPPSSI